MTNQMTNQKLDLIIHNYSREVRDKMGDICSITLRGFCVKVELWKNYGELLEQINMQMNNHVQSQMINQLEKLNGQ